MSDETVEINTKGLDKLLKALKDKAPVVRVGILGAKDQRSKNGNSNATIGAKHEFGSDGMPIRSFLRVPLTENLDKKLESSGLIDKDAMNEVLKTGSIIPWLKKIAIVAVEVVNEAFDTGGNGKWPAWRNPNYKNNTGMLLVDTQQLRNSITSEVK